jgi:hypothetical protein
MQRRAKTAKKRACEGHMNELKRFAESLRQVTPSNPANVKLQLLENPLSYDRNQAGMKPWNDPSEYVPYLFDAWKIIREKLLPYFDTRKARGDKELMLKGMICMITCFYWIEGCRSGTYDWNELSNKDFKVAPINWKERAEFILQKPNQYPAFIQLDELFTEMEKQFYKWKAMSKKR